MIYFDNAATSFPKPPSVIKEINFCLKKYCGNPGRSSHRMSVMASEAIYEARENIAKLLGVDTPEQVVFTYNATYALNLAIKTFITHKCHILISDFEHNSVIRPIEKLKRTLGIEYDTFSTDGDIKENIKALIRADTEGIVCSIASNVTGERISLKLLSNVARENGLFLIIDASQAIGHEEINLTKTPCDVLCAPGHKALFGIQGCGFAYFKENKRKESFIEGGSGSDSASIVMPMLLPEAFEAGTLSTPAIVSLSKGTEYVMKIGTDDIQHRLDSLCNAMEERLENIKAIRLYKSGNGIISFNLSDVPSSRLSMALDRRGVCVRGGLHCAPSVHRRLGTLDVGAVRMSFSYFNKKSEIDKAYKILREIAEQI